MGMLGFMVISLISDKFPRPSLRECGKILRPTCPVLGLKNDTGSLGQPSLCFLPLITRLTQIDLRELFYKTGF